MPSMTRRLVFSMAAAAAITAGGARICAAYSVFGHWDPTTSSGYPVIPARACPNQYATFFSTPWDPIRRQFLSAANEWFTSGGADVRVRLQGDLAASDPRCSNTSAANPNPGEILVTAEKNNGGGMCFLATTFWWTNGARIERAKVIMHSGTACTGTYQAYPWSNGDVPTAGQYDFWSVYQHELGHALGFDHSTDPNAVMMASALMGSIQLRNLSTDERLGLRNTATGYPRILTSSQHRRSIDDGASWLNEGEPFAVDVIGSPSLCYGTAAGRYLVASTLASNDTVVAYWTNGVTSAGTATLPIQSHLPPAIGCASGQYVVAAVANDPARTVVVSTSPDGVTWSAPTSLGISSSLPPALAYAPWQGVFVLVTTDIASGSLQTRLSSNGTSWAAPQSWPYRTSSPYGIDCRSASGSCELAWADAERSYTPLRSATLGFLPLGMGLTATATYDLGLNSYGGGVASNGSRFQRTWRDRGTATVLTSGGWSSPATLSPLTFTGTVIHAAPNLAWGAAWSEWSSWYAVAARYDR